MFSIPLNPKLSENQFNDFLQFCKKHKELIFDIYFTCRIPPFIQDAMGDIYQTNDDIYQLIQTALYIQNETGINMSATFNNTLIPPTQKNLDIFLSNFKSLYDAGIRSITIPHTHWVSSKQIKKHFPDIFIKNTILRNVTQANQVFELAKNGFDYVNIHRDLMRNVDTLKEIKEVSNLTGIKIALLANEGCIGNCPMMDEHFQFNNSRMSGPSYFQDSISRVSCQKWNIEDTSVPFKSAILSPWKDDWDEMLKYVDVFKMHGRESPEQLYSTMGIIENYSNNNSILYEEFQKYRDEFNIPESPLNIWRKTIKNCKFNCWKCNVCENVAKKHIKKDINPKLIKLVNELVNSVNYDNNLNIPGLTSKRVQNLLYGIGTFSKKYLEIGSAMGSTVSAVGYNDIEIICIDKWEENIQDEKSFLNLPKNTKQIFDANTKHIKNINVIQDDFNNVDESKIFGVDFFFYDGPHDFENTRNALMKYYKTFDKTCICVFDDANWVGVSDGVNTALKELDANVIYSKYILNDVEDKNMWWNGLYILVIQKNEYPLSKQNLILTKECDKRCSFCFTHNYDKNTEMSIDFIKKLVYEHPEITGFSLLGGEPTQHSQFIEIINYLDKENIDFRLITNMLFNENILTEILNSKCSSLLCNGMELDKNKRIELFSYNWNKLNSQIDCYLAITISDYHTIEYFLNYCSFIKKYIQNIKFIRIGLDLKGDYIINNHLLGDIIKIIWNTLANDKTNLIFDCFLPHCIFNYKIEDELIYMSEDKYMYNANCEGAIGDIFNDGTMIYCYPLQSVKVDNIFENSLFNSFSILNNQYIVKNNHHHETCLKCEHLLKTCSGICLACK